MRVTRIIREYVEKRVREQFPKTTEELAWEAEKDKMSKAIEQAEILIGAYAEQVIKELNEKYEFKDYCLKKHNYYHVTDTYQSDSIIYQISLKAKEERNKKINKTIEDILISLELGGTKAELEEMLANIGK